MFLNQLGNLSILEEISQVVQVPVKFIHVHRNPFDNIATMMLRATESRDAVREDGVRVSRILCFSLTSYITLLIELLLLMS